MFRSGLLLTDGVQFFSDFNMLVPMGDCLVIDFLESFLQNDGVGLKSVICIFATLNIEESLENAEVAGLAVEPLNFFQFIGEFRAGDLASVVIVEHEDYASVFVECGKLLKHELSYAGA